jgi:hypothetical protein
MGQTGESFSGGCGASGASRYGLDWRERSREAVQAILSWSMAPGILFGFAVGNYGGHDLQWPYLIAIATNFALYSILFFFVITFLLRRR